MILVLLFILIIVLSIYLQLILSKKENNILGLILPFMTILNSLLYFLQATSFWAGVKAFIITNIFTIILLFIYIKCKKGIKKNIQDVE